MATFRKILTVSVFLLVLVYGILFVSGNAQTVPLNLVLLPAFEQSMAAIVIVTFCTGGFLGLLFSFSVYLKLKAQVAHTRRKLRSTEKELEKCRLPSAKG